jgi:hypothetical protein
LKARDVWAPCSVLEKWLLRTLTPDYNSGPFFMSNQMPSWEQRVSIRIRSWSSGWSSRLLEWNGMEERDRSSEILTSEKRTIAIRR